KRLRSTLEEDFAGTRYPTQVGRLFAELGVESIPAYSPQAKGRVERFWGTAQGRLPEELHLEGIRTLEEANAYLPTYLERHRAQFAKPPLSPDSVYAPIDANTDLDRLFCFKYQRRVGNDNTVHFDGQIIQIPPGPDRISYARALVEVHERLDASIAVYHRGQLLVLVPPPTEPSPLRSRGSRFPHPITASTFSAERPLSWDEVRRRARAASGGPSLVED